MDTSYCFLCDISQFSEATPATWHVYAHEPGGLAGDRMIGLCDECARHGWDAATSQIVGQRLAHRDHDRVITRDELIAAGGDA